MGYASEYDPDTDVDRWFTDATGSAIANWIRPGDTLLELGCATGRMSAQFAAAGAAVVGVDREPSYLARAADRALDGATWIEGDLADPTLFERAFDGLFDHVVVANVVHEVHDPVSLLNAASSQLQPWGLLHLSLQNPRSLHRLIGFATGSIDSVHEISDRGQQYETIGLYDDLELRALARRAGLVDIHHEGVMIKPTPNAALELEDDSTLEGFLAGGRFLPAHAAMNYLIFRTGT